MLRLLRAPYSGASASNMWMGVLQHVKIVLSVELFELLSVLCLYSKLCKTIITSRVTVVKC